MSTNPLPLDSAVLEDYLARIAAAGSAQEKKEIIAEYYQYIADQGHWYGNLAFQASQNVGFAGRLANN